MHSMDVSECRHIFHEMCVCEWLVKQSTSACPCCRQVFVGMETPVTSLSTPEEFHQAFCPDIGNATPSYQEEGQV